MITIIKNLKYDYLSIFKRKLRYTFYDTKNKLKELWLDFIRPQVPYTYKEIGLVPSSFLTLHKVTEPKGYLTTVQTFDTDTDLKKVRSWLLPWKYFYYIDLYSKEAVNSSYYIIHSTIKNGAYKSKEDLANSIIDKHNSMIDVINRKTEWFAPAGLTRGLINVDNSTNINKVEGTTV